MMALKNVETHREESIPTSFGYGSNLLMKPTAKN
jgi:hypothetical protein